MVRVKAAGVVVEAKVRVRTRARARGYIARAMANVRVGFTGRMKERVRPKAISSVTGQSHDQIMTRQDNRKERQSNYKTGQSQNRTVVRSQDTVTSQDH